MNMKRILFSLFALLAIGGSIQAQSNIVDVIKVGDVDITKGGEATIDIKYDATNEPELGLKGLQFALFIPKGFSLKTKTVGPLTLIKIDQGEISKAMFDVSPSVIDHENEGKEYRFVMKPLILGALFSYLSDENNILFSVTLVADADVKSDFYDAYAKGYGSDERIQLSGPTSQGDMTYYQAPIKFKIKMPIELSETEDYAEGFGNYTEATVIMNTRTLKADTWNTICLPFKIEGDQIANVFGADNEVTLAEFTAYKKTENGDNVNITLQFTSCDLSTNGIAANTPYLIKLSKGVTTFTVGSTSFPTLDGEYPEVDKGVIFRGNYVKMEGLNNVMYLSNNTVKVAKGNTSLKSFRGYFIYEDVLGNASNGANVSVFVDDEPTGIRTISSDQDNDDVYDISGRKVNSDKTTLQKGIYIINGKKETVH